MFTYISFYYFNAPTVTLMSKLFVISKSLRILPALLVPIISNLFSFLFGIFFIKTKRAYKTTFENLGPKSTNSINLSILSSIMQD